MKSLVMISLIFLFSGCAEKIVFKDKLVCVEQLTVPRATAEIRVYKDDIEIAKAYKESNDSAFGFYENQVEKNNELCKGLSHE